MSSETSTSGDRPLGRLVRMVSLERLSWGARSVVGVVVAALIAMGAGWVYATGGTQHAWVHLLYVPVLLAAWAFGPVGGVAAGVAAGLAVGPGMPVDVDAGLVQATTNWAYRLGFFTLIGAVSGGLHHLVRVQLAHSRAERRRFASLVQHAPDLVMACDARGLVTYASPSITRLLGYPVESAVGTALVDLLHADDAVALRAMTRPHAVPWSPVELRVRHADGSWRHLEMVVNNLLDDRDVAAVVCNARDVTERRAVESELRHHMWHDMDTGLPNRALFTQALAAAVAPTSSGEQSAAAVLLIHLNRFRSVQETFGPDTGELLIFAMAQRLLALMRPDDQLARFSTTEFAVLCPNVGGPEDARCIAQRLLQAADEPFPVADGEVRLSTAIGLALACDTDHDAGQLIRDVHSALHHAIRSGAQIATFDVDWREQDACEWTSVHDVGDRGSVGRLRRG